VYHAASPADLSPYIRTVLKISQEDTENRQALKKLHEQRPTLEELLRHIAESPEDIESRRTLAAHYLKEGLYYSAFELYEQIRSTGFEDATAERGLARIWDKWGHYSLAKRHAEGALVLDPQSAEALEILGTIHLHGNDPQAAVSAFLEALALTPENPSLHSTIGSVLLKLGNSGEARGYLEEAVALDPALIEARNNLAEALARLGDDDGALYEFTAANPPAGAFNKLGLVYLEDRKWAKAQHAFKQALVQDPDYVKARLNLSIAQSYLPPPTIIHLPSLEVASSAWQAYGIENSGIETPPDQDTRTPLSADAERVSVEDVQDDREEGNRADLDPQPGPSGASAHLPTTAIVFLAPFEESSPTLYSPDLIPNTRDQEEKQVSELKLTVQDPFTGPKLSPTLNVIQLQTLSQSDPMDGEPLEDHLFLVGPLAERKLVSASPPDDDGALGNVVPEQIASLGKGVNSVPRIVLETSSQMSALERSAYLDPAVFLLNPNLVRGNGQVHQNPLSPLVDYNIAYGVYPDMTEQGWEQDDWPQIYEKVKVAEILVITSAIWLGEKTSVCTKTIERLYSNSGDLSDNGQYIYYGRVGGCLITGNEDGAKHCSMNILYSLQHLGYVIPPQADADWLGPAGPGPSYLDPGSGGPENDFTNRNTTFMTWNLLHLARMIKDGGGIPAHGNQRSQWDAGCRFDHPNPLYR